MTEPTSDSISTNQIIMEPITVPYYAVYSYEQEYKCEKQPTWYNGKEHVRQTRYNIYEMEDGTQVKITEVSQDPNFCLLYTSPSPRDISGSRMPSSA